MKRFLCVAICLVITLSLFGGCGEKNATAVDVEDLVVPTYTDDKEIRLTADLPPDQSDRAQLETYMAAGFNAIPLTEDFANINVEDLLREDYESSGYIQALKLCEELGLDVYIRPHSKFVSKVGSGEREETYFEKYFSKIDFKKYPAVKGFFICDEPTYNQLTDLKNSYLPWFNENYADSGLEWCVNFLACNSSAYKDSKTTKQTYSDCVDYYFDNVLSQVKSSNKIFTIDFYPLFSDGNNNYIHDTYVKANYEAATAAKENDVDFGAYVQCFTGYSTLRRPESVADISFQVYFNLAFGAKKLGFYGYRDYQSEKHMVTAGEPNEVYYFVKQVNEEIKKFDHVFMSFDWEGVFTSVGTGSRLKTNEAFEMVRTVKLEKLDGVVEYRSKYDTVAGQLEDKDGNTGFMLVNYDEPSKARKNDVSMTFEDADGVLVYKNGEPKVIGLANHEYSLTLEAGEGVFIIPLYKK